MCGSLTSPQDEPAISRRVVRFVVSDKLVGLFGEKTFARVNDGYLTVMGTRADPKRRVAASGFPFELARDHHRLLLREEPIAQVANGQPIALHSRRPTSLQIVALF